VTVAAVATLPADFDSDGDVDGDDLADWRAGFGTGTTHAQGDADGDSDVDGSDFLAWQQQLGSAPSVATATAVPEPATMWLVLAAMVGLAGRRGRAQ
jgi:hypothetical protein